MTDAEDLKPVSGESCSIDFDEDTQCWGLFGDESGFCYRLVTDKSELEKDGVG